MKQKLKNWLAVIKAKGPQGIKGFLIEAVWLALFWGTTVLTFSSFKVCWTLMGDSNVLAVSAGAIGLALLWANLCIYGFWTEGSVKRRLEKRYDQEVVNERLKLDRDVAKSVKATLVVMAANLKPAPAEVNVFGNQPGVKVELTHSDDNTIDMFAAAMKTRLKHMRAAGRADWETGGEEYMKGALIGNAAKGDWIDTANFAAFLWNRGAL